MKKVLIKTLIRTFIDSIPMKLLLLRDFFQYINKYKAEKHQSNTFPQKGVRQNIFFNQWFDVAVTIYIGFDCFFPWPHFV